MTYNIWRIIDFTISSRIFTRISAFIERLPNLSYRESAGSPHEHTGSINLDVVMAYMLAHTATIHLYSTSILPDDLQNRLGAALAIGQLADALQGEEMRMRSQVLMVSCLYCYLLDSALNTYLFRRVVPAPLRSWTRVMVISVLDLSFRL